ncbi:MAG: hypothetical protein ACO1NY_14550, partial [Pseudorhodoplanes sp.]
MALRIYPATLLVAIAAVLGMAAITNAAQDDAARWPNIYEPQWPNVSASAGRDQQKPAGVTAV